MNCMIRKIIPKPPSKSVSIWLVFIYSVCVYMFRIERMLKKEM